jgi:Cu+-exporting ATPase
MDNPNSLVERFHLNHPIWLVAGALIAILLIALVVIVIKSGSKKGKVAPQPVIPEFIEVFSVDTAVFEIAPYKEDDDSVIDEYTLKTITLTLLVGLGEYLTKMHENPSDQHKAMDALGKDLEAKGVYPIAYTQWNQSPIQGIAAKVIIDGKIRTALLGPSLAMARATTKFPDSINQVVESAHEKGNTVLVLAIDGLAYGVYEISHRLQEVLKS